MPILILLDHAPSGLGAAFNGGKAVPFHRRKMIPGRKLSWLCAVGARPEQYLRTPGDRQIPAGGKQRLIGRAVGDSALNKKGPPDMHPAALLHVDINRFAGDQYFCCRS
jgi:hypothetical protein